MAVPNAPTSLTVTMTNAANASQAVLAWTAPATGATPTGYNVYQAVLPSLVYALTPVQPAGAAVTVTIPVTSNNTTLYKVCASDADGEGAASNVATGTSTGLYALTGQIIINANISAAQSSGPGVSSTPSDNVAIKKTAPQTAGQYLYVNGIEAGSGVLTINLKSGNNSISCPVAFTTITSVTIDGNQNDWTLGSADSHEQALWKATGAALETLKAGQTSCHLGLSYTVSASGILTLTNLGATTDVINVLITGT